MQQFSLLEKGQTAIKVTGNYNGITSSNVALYKITEDASGNPILTNITPTTPNFGNIVSGRFSQFIFDAPNENCYVFVKLGDMARFYRVGTPTIRVYTYYAGTGLTKNFSLYDFSGNTVKNSTLTELGLGIYYFTPTALGDYIVELDDIGIVPLHTPYVVDSVGMRGKIVFQKDRWMLLAIPKANYKIADVVADIEAKYGVTGNQLFRVFSAYPANTGQVGEMLDFKPGVTPTTTKYNFDLVYNDTDSAGATTTEITGFWCKTLAYDLKALGVGTASELVTYSWVN